MGYAARCVSSIQARLPGLGPVLGARALAEFGDDPARYSDAKARKAYAGTAPITRASGTRRTVLARVARNRHRGVTYYNFSSDQFTGFHAIVIPGTLRDSLFILDGLLEHQTSMRPVELMADTAGSSDVVFGLFWLLGYQFSPRLADIGEATFWRIDGGRDSPR